MTALDSLTFEVPGRPVSWKRTGGTGRRYKLPEQKAYQETIAWAFLRERAGRPWPKEGLFRVSVLAVMPHRRSWPDRDNILKGVQDALNGVAYEDDRQAISGPTDVKRWPPKAKKEGFLRVTITRLPEGADIYEEGT